MYDRYNKILSIDRAKWIVDCPVILKKGALLHDNTSNRNLLQLKFQSIIDKVIIAIELQYKAYSLGDELLGEDKFSYLDLNIRINEEFGEKMPIYINQNNARNFSFIVYKVFFEDGSVWNSTTILEDILFQKPIQNFLQNLAPQFQREYEKYSKNKTALFFPVVNDDNWQCTCGTLNLGFFNCCRMCGISKASLIKILDKNFLNEQNTKYEHTEQERIEKERKESEEHQIKQRKIMTTLSVSVVGLLVTSLLIYISIVFVIPNSKYSSAMKKFNEGKYNLAIEKFKELNDYKDSLNKLMESKYYMAKTYYNSQNYENALSLFTDVNDYQDSAEYIKLCNNYIQYNNAKELADNNNYEDALDSLLSLPRDFEDVDALRIEYATIIGDAYFNEKEYDKAIEIFAMYNVYNDSYKESCYQMGIKYKGNSKYEDAITYFEKCGDYKKSKKNIKSCNKAVNYNTAIDYMEKGLLDKAIPIYNKLGNYKNSKKYKAICQKYMHYCGVWKCVAHTITWENGQSFNEDYSASDENMDCLVKVSKKGKVTLYFNRCPAKRNGSVVTWHQYGKKWDTNTFNLITGNRTMQFYNSDGSKSDIYTYRYKVR